MGYSGYLFVFGVSFIGLLQGGTNNALIDSILYLIFLLVSYICVLLLYNNDKKKSIPYISTIIILCLIYFSIVNYIVLSTVILLFFYLIFLKKNNFVYDPLKSVFSNYIKNSNIFENLFFIMFFLTTLYFNIIDK
jgi:hypothetical protein